jgi:hypothetical protein
MKKRTIFGLPLNPQPTLDELRGESFCVSYATRHKLGKQLDQAIELVGADGVLLIDNGAFSAWQKGEPLDVAGFCKWASDICERCPQAVVVVPDVIDGDAQENDQRIRDWFDDCFENSVSFPNEMVVWHLHEPLERLGELIEGDFHWLAFGSSGEFAKCGTKKWHARIREAFAYIEKFCSESNGAYARPWVHMMRAQAELSAYDFDSADSTNVAMNHGRYKHQGAGHVRRFADRVKAPIDSSCDGHERREVEAPSIQAEWFNEWRTVAA